MTALARKPLVDAPTIARVASPLLSRRRSLYTFDASAAPPVTANRFKTTLEVIVSKIFPAGFGWQAASVVAGGMGYQASSANFFLMTGAGDFAGVFAGHNVYSVTNRLVEGKSDVLADVPKGLWLGSAAFCSGTAWQSTVNLSHDQLGTSFASTAVGTGAVTRSQTSLTGTTRPAWQSLKFDFEFGLRMPNAHPLLLDSRCPRARRLRTYSSSHRSPLRTHTSATVQARTVTDRRSRTPAGQVARTWSRNSVRRPRRDRRTADTPCPPLAKSRPTGGPTISSV
jgi:hypothetical protein